jgi:Acetokinase family
MREMLAGADAGNDRATLALDMFVHRVVAALGSMAATLGGVDALVFTGGIGEHNATVRERVISALPILGVQLDHERNASPGLFGTKQVGWERPDRVHCPRVGRAAFGTNATPTRRAAAPRTRARWRGTAWASRNEMSERIGIAHGRQLFTQRSRPFCRNAWLGF